MSDRRTEVCLSLADWKAIQRVIARQQRIRTNPRPNKPHSFRNLDPENRPSHCGDNSEFGRLVLPPRPPIGNVGGSFHRSARGIARPWVQSPPTGKLATSKCFHSPGMFVDYPLFSNRRVCTSSPSPRGGNLPGTASTGLFDGRARNQRSSKTQSKFD
jgi:hypothetical protein